MHLGQDDTPVAEAREQLGPDVLIGLSTHSPEQFDAALRSGADQLSVGPVWETPTTKGGRPAAGLDYVRYAASRGGDVPVVRDRRDRLGQRGRGGRRRRSPGGRARNSRWDDPERAARGLHEVLCAA